MWKYRLLLFTPTGGWHERAESVAAQTDGLRWSLLAACCSCHVKTGASSSRQIAIVVQRGDAAILVHATVFNTTHSTADPSSEGRARAVSAFR
jgi:cytochrome c553